MCRNQPALCSKEAPRPEQLLSPAELASYLKVPLDTVYAWNSRGGGPRRLTVGKHVRYRLEDVEAWLDSRQAAA
jgi:excisionase family DNA binding protein